MCTDVRRRARGVWRASMLAASVLLGVAATGCGSGAPKSPVDVARASALIARSYATVFDLTNKSVGPKLAEIQDGSSLETALDQALSSSESAEVTGGEILRATVLSATACRTSSIPAPCAEVVYNVLGPTRSPLLPTQTGYAVYVGGAWVVAKVTVCGFFGLLYKAEGKGGAPPGCGAPS